MAYEFYTDRLAADEAPQVKFTFTTNEGSDCDNCAKRERDEATAMQRVLFETAQDSESRQVSAFCDNQRRKDTSCGLGSFTVKKVSNS